MLLIFPPVAKPCEPPAGIAKLAGALNAHGISCEILDANLEGLLYLLQQPQAASDTWTRRAVKNISSNLAALREPHTYRAPDHYSRAVKDVNRVLVASAKAYHAIVGLADYHHQQRSPLRSADLLAAAEHPEQNPFYPYFKFRLTDILDNTVSTRRRQGREEYVRKGQRVLVGSSRARRGHGLDRTGAARMSILGTTLGHIRVVELLASGTSAISVSAACATGATARPAARASASRPVPRRMPG